MSVLTKVAIVFHVIVSLLLAAGLIVFVNRTENFKVSLAAANAKASRSDAQLQKVQLDDSAQKTYVDAARKERDAAIADGQKSLLQLQSEIGGLKAQIADAQSSAKIMQVTQDNLTSALNASEAGRKALADSLDSTRKDNNDLTTKYSQSQLAISDLTNKLEVAIRNLTNSTETVAELKAALGVAQAQVKDLGGKVGGPETSGLGAGAPPIDAVVRSTRPINGIPYATISVGADAQVKPGMKFTVFDRKEGTFLGELTIEQVDEKESTGKLEGPKINQVQTGTEVHTES